MRQINHSDKSGRIVLSYGNTNICILRLVRRRSGCFEPLRSSPRSYCCNRIAALTIIYRYCSIAAPYYTSPRTHRSSSRLFRSFFIAVLLRDTYSLVQRNALSANFSDIFHRNIMRFKYFKKRPLQVFLSNTM